MGETCGVGLGEGGVLEAAFLRKFLYARLFQIQRALPLLPIEVHQVINLLGFLVGWLYLLLGELIFLLVEGSVASLGEDCPF